MDKVNPDKVKKAPKHQGKWKAGEDVEALGMMLSKYLTNASQFAHINISSQRPSSRMDDGITASHVEIWKKCVVMIIIKLIAQKFLSMAT